MKDLNKRNNYICFSCGSKYGLPSERVVTMHGGICGWCNQEKCITHFRNYGYPIHPDEKDKEQ